jgi:hypothetical protein
MRNSYVRLLLVAMLATACATTPPDAVSTPASTSSPIAVASARPAHSEGSETPAPEAAPPRTEAPAVTDAPDPTPATMGAAEQSLVDELPYDVSFDCQPRRTDLPENAIAGVDCAVDDPWVARIGLYRTLSPHLAAVTYLERMASAAVDITDGDCDRDIPGDRGWSTDEEGFLSELEPAPDPFPFLNYSERWYSTRRVGCFLNDEGFANARASCDDIYVGILGRQGDLSDLMTWAFAGGSSEDPDAGLDRVGRLRTGICWWDTSGQ